MDADFGWLHHILNRNNQYSTTKTERKTQIVRLNKLCQNSANRKFLKPIYQTIRTHYARFTTVASPPAAFF